MLNCYVRKALVLMAIGALCFSGAFCKDNLIKKYRYDDLINQIEEIVQNMRDSLPKQNNIYLLFKSPLSLASVFSKELTEPRVKTRTRDVYETVCGEGISKKGAYSDLGCRHLKIAQEKYIVPQYSIYKEYSLLKINLYRGQFWVSWVKNDVPLPRHSIPEYVRKFWAGMVRKNTILWQYPASKYRGYFGFNWVRENLTIPAYHKHLLFGFDNLLQANLLPHYSSPMLVGFEKLPQDVCEKILAHDWSKLKIDTVILNKAIFSPYSYEVSHLGGALNVKQHYLRLRGVKGQCVSRSENFIELLFE